jgi:uncharacterized protein YecE (DUF72 family)
VTAIEINATFYRTQSAKLRSRSGRAATPDDFMFSVKAPRAAVQRKDLREAAQSIQWFFESRRWRTRRQARPDLLADGALQEIRSRDEITRLFRYAAGEAWRS